LEATAEEKPSNGSTETCEQTRGRTEYRRCTIWTDVSAIDTKRWSGVQTILKVERWGVREGKHYAHDHWFITSLKALPSVHAEIVRLHWEVENNAHRTKDVIFEEDDIRSANHNLNAVFALAHNIAINLFRFHGHHSITHAIERFTNLVKELFKMFRT
jgi:predicted transposase YbfD/YdcC